MPTRKFTPYWILSLLPHTCLPWNLGWGQRTTCGNWFFPSIMWIPGIKLSQTWIQTTLPVSLISLAPLKLLLLLFYLRYWLETYCWCSKYIFYIYLLLVLERTTAAMFPWREEGRNVFGFFVLSLAHHSAQETFAKYSLKNRWER